MSRPRGVTGVAVALVLVTAVLSALLADRGIWAVRVHDPATTMAAIAVVRHMRAAA